MMKKMLMMAAVAAMAFGAQAVDYSYGLTLKEIPITVLQSEKLKSITCYLVDRSQTSSSVKYNGKSVMAKFEFNGKKSGTSGVNYDEQGNVTGLTYNYAGYNTSGTEVTPRAQTVTAVQRSESKGGVMVYDFNSFTVGKITWTDMGKDKTAVDNYCKEKVTAYLEAEVWDAEQNAYVKQVYSLPVNANNSEYALGSSATYQQVIPEPTSGMLVFFGLAGLMLKRKRAA